MKRFLILSGMVALACASQAAITIDDFTVGAFAMTGKADQYSTQTGATPNIIQGFRYNSFAFSGNPSNRTMTSEIDAALPGNYFFEAGTGVSGSMVAAWFSGLQNGVSASGPGGLTTNDVTAFNPLVDLSGQTSLQLSYKDNDQNTTVNFGIYSADLSTAEEHSLAMTSGAGTLNMSLANFTNIDLSQIGGLYLRIEIPNGNDFTLTNYQAVPEPASIIAIGAGLAALARRRKR